MSSVLLSDFLRVIQLISLSGPGRLRPTASLDPAHELTEQHSLWSRNGSFVVREGKALPITYPLEATRAWHRWKSTG